jgi:GxxExxY protein
MIMRFDEFRAHRSEQFDDCDELTGAFLGAAVEVHKVLGPGLNESHHESALCQEMDLRHIPYERQVLVPVYYKGSLIGETRVDLVIGRRIIVELKACEALSEVHRAQLITYLRLCNLKLGLLVNFNVPLLKQGIKRVILSA